MEFTAVRGGSQLFAAPSVSWFLMFRRSAAIRPDSVQLGEQCYHGVT